MKIIGINGSPRKNGNTEILIKTVFQELEKEGIETELVQLGGKLVHGCTACMKCREIRDGRCHIKNDLINQMIIPGSSYWNFAFGGAPGDVLKDEEGIRTMRTLGENMDWVMQKLR